MDIAKELKSIASAKLTEGTKFCVEAKRCEKAGLDADYTRTAEWFMENVSNVVVSIKRSEKLLN